jgi:hypothetical protein
MCQRPPANQKAVGILHGEAAFPHQRMRPAGNKIHGAGGRTDWLEPCPLTPQAAFIRPRMIKKRAENRGYFASPGFFIRERMVFPVSHCLPVVRMVQAIHKMLSAYCRITQSGSEDVSITIAPAFFAE